MNNLLIQKQEIEENIKEYERFIINKEKEQSELTYSLEQVASVLEELNQDKSKLESELADIDLEIEEWTEDNEQDLNEDIRNQSNPNEN